AVLGAQSQVFADMFDDIQDRTQVVVPVDFKASVLRIVINFIYTAELPRITFQAKEIEDLVLATIACDFLQLSNNNLSIYIINNLHYKLDSTKFKAQQITSSANSENVEIHTSLILGVLNALRSNPRNIHELEKLWTSVARYAIFEYARTFDIRIISSLSEIGLRKVLEVGPKKEWKTKFYILIAWLNYTDNLKTPCVIPPIRVAKGMLKANEMVWDEEDITPNISKEGVVLIEQVYFFLPYGTCEEFNEVVEPLKILTPKQILACYRSIIFNSRRVYLD
ncbi:hypothetical protein HK096_007417, partial [Nowakowskiella sp. JEL0078]